MNRLNILLIASIIFLNLSCTSEKKENEWIELFNGKDLSNWSANENPGSFKVEDGMIIANGLRSHLFYVGDGKEPVDFKNFELSMDVKTHHLANSGLYFHTAYQKEGWLNQGYEVQINNSHKGEGDYREVKKGGSLYLIRNLYKAYVPDSVWYNLWVKVEGKRIQIKMNDQLVVDYTEPKNPSRKNKKQVISSGTFALQGHDYNSTVFFKNIRVKKLPDTPSDSEPSAADTDVFPKTLDYQADHFAFIDHHILTDDAFHIESAMQYFYKTGINLGLVADPSRFNKGTEEAQLKDYLNKYSKYPVFLGVIADQIGALEGISHPTLEGFDYIIGGVTKFKNSKGEEVDLFKNQNIGNKETFMNEYVKAIEERLEKGDLNIWSSATFLPESLAGEYNQLWTTDRMTKVIEAAKRNNIAIEINEGMKIPSISFLKLVKEKGCLFSFKGLVKESKTTEPAYLFEVIDRCKLNYKDIYIPGNSN